MNHDDSGVALNSTSPPSIPDSFLISSAPEIIKQALTRVSIPNEETKYVLARLTESVAYPNMQSPQMKAKFDLLRRQIAARMGNFKEAFNLAAPADPASACIGILKSFVAAHQLGSDKLIQLLESGSSDHTSLSLLSHHNPKEPQMLTAPSDKAQIPSLPTTRKVDQ